MDGVGLIDAYEFIERAIKVRRDFLLDQHYVVSDKGEIVIVDEFTGRLAEGRKWRDGIHQAIEAKEKIEITVDTGQAARITIQDLFLRYQFLAGMTGTALDVGPRISQDLQDVGRADSHESPAAADPSARSRLWLRRRQMARDCESDRRAASTVASGAGGHANDREIGIACPRC